MLKKIEYLAYACKNGCKLWFYASNFAAQYGQLECLQYLHDNGLMYNTASHYAAENGHIKCLQYAYETYCLWDGFVCEYAAKNGHIECLRYALTQGCPYNKVKCIQVSKDREVVAALFAELGL